MAIQFKKISDPVKDAAGNVVVTVVFWDDATPSKTYTEVYKAFDASDANIGDWATKRYAVNATADAAIVALAATKNVPTAATPKLDSIKVATLQAAQKDASRKGRKAQAKFWGDQEYIDAITALEAAEDDLGK